MFELKRSQRVQEDIKLGDEVISINLDVDSIATNFRKCQVDLIKAEQKLKSLKQGETDGEVAIEEYGNALIALLRLVFGEENTAKVLNFYENNYVELSLQVIPFVAGVIVPAVTQSLQNTKQQMAQRYKGKQKRRIK